MPGLAAVYLYGSYGTPFQTPLSDVDLALVFVDGEEPSPHQRLELIGRITETWREDDVSVTILNRAPLAFRHRVLAEGRRLFLRDEIAHADFVERTVTRYCDFAIDEARFFEEYDWVLIEGVLSWRRLIARRCVHTSIMCATTCTSSSSCTRRAGRHSLVTTDPRLPLPGGCKRCGGCDRHRQPRGRARRTGCPARLLGDDRYAPGELPTYVKPEWGGTGFTIDPPDGPTATVKPLWTGEVSTALPVPVPITSGQ